MGTVDVACVFFILSQTNNPNVWTAMVAPILTFIFGLMARPIVDWIERWLFGPKLSLIFDAYNGGFAFFDDVSRLDTDKESLPPEAKDGELYVRVCVTNDKMRVALNCRAYLVSIEKRMRYDWEPVLNESIPLIWSYNDTVEATELPQKVAKHFDVLRIYNTAATIYPRLRSASGHELKLKVLETAFNSPSLYRIKVLVSADNALSEISTFTIDTGVWPPEAANGSHTPASWHDRYRGAFADVST